MNNENVSSGGGKVNARWIVVGISAFVLLMLVLCGIGGGVYLLVTTQQAEITREANERSYDLQQKHLQSKMDYAMKRYQRGEISNAEAMRIIDEVAEAQNKLHSQ